MGRLSKDSKLLELAKRLNDFGRFDDPSGYYDERSAEYLVAGGFDQKGRQIQRFHHASVSGDRPIKRVCMIPNSGGKLFGVRISYCRDTYTIGITTCLASAMRYADMATVHFWKYRRRTSLFEKNNEPGDLDLNFKLSYAQQDLGTLTEAHDLLVALESHFRRNYGWIRRDEYDAAPPSIPKQARTRKTLGDIMGMVLALGTRMDLFDRALTAMSVQLSARELKQSVNPVPPPPMVVPTVVPVSTTISGHETDAEGNVSGASYGKLFNALLKLTERDTFQNDLLARMRAGKPVPLTDAVINILTPQT